MKIQQDSSGDTRSWVDRWVWSEHKASFNVTKNT